METIQEAEDLYRNEKLQATTKGFMVVEPRCPSRPGNTTTIKPVFPKEVPACRVLKSPEASPKTPRIQLPERPLTPHMLELSPAPTSRYPQLPATALKYVAEITELDTDSELDDQ